MASSADPSAICTSLVTMSPAGRIASRREGRARHSGDRICQVEVYRSYESRHPHSEHIGRFSDAAHERAMVEQG